MGDNIPPKIWNALCPGSAETSSIYTTTSIAILIATILCLLWSVSSYFRTRDGKLPLPPGSFGLPVIGETFDFLQAWQSDIQYREWMRKKVEKYGEFFKSHLLGSPTVIMDHPAGNKFLFQNEGRLLENNWPWQVRKLLGPDSIAMKVGEEHKVLRRHFGGFLEHAAVIRYLEGVELSMLSHFENHWDGKEQLVALDMTKRFTFSTICNLLVSLDEGSDMDELRYEFVKWTHGMLKLPINLPGFAYYSSMKARKRILQILDRIVVQRKQEMAEGRMSDRAKVDVLSSLLTVPDEKGEFTSESSIKDNLLLLLFAGYDTTSNALALIIYFIAKHPHVYSQLVQEHTSIIERKRESDDRGAGALTMDDLSAMKYSWKVIQETLRIQPPAAMGFRKAITDIEYNGYLIPKGWRLMWSNQRAHDDPRFFQDPLTFDPSRWDKTPTPFTFIPFGGGPRHCPGYEFVKMEMLVFLHHLIKKYQWTLVDPHERIVRDPFPRTEKRTPIKVTKITSF
ncbi:hypothetical protein R1flu_017058 [Riccia fluitans]|uniref:Cytochrome P450 n=1 Tax=Riccia fluitans TaxID=41844 RepID=A0ABD1YNM4_9MARC